MKPQEYERVLAAVKDGLGRGPDSARAVRAVLWSIIDAGHVLASSFNQDPSVMAFREGERAVGQWAMRLLLDAGSEHFTRARAEAEAARSKSAPVKGDDRADIGDT